MELVKSQISDFNYEYFENILSEHTRVNYRRDLNQFLSFLLEFHPEVRNPAAIRVAHILDFKKHLQSELNYAPKSVHRKLASLSNYFQYLIQNEVIQSNPVKAVKRGKCEVVTHTQALDDNEVEEVFKALNASTSTLHKATIYLLFATGIRREELVNIRLRDFTRENGAIFLHVTGKGGTSVTKLIPEAVYSYLQLHLEGLSAQGVEIKPDDFVLVLKRKNLVDVITSQSVYNWIKEYAKKAGITKNISPHSIRATYITSALESGMQIHKISEDVGHKKIDTTLGYNKRRKAKTESPVNSIPFLKNIS